MIEAIFGDVSDGGDEKGYARLRRFYTARVRLFGLPYALKTLTCVSYSHSMKSSMKSGHYLHAHCRQTSISSINALKAYH